jgi:hypothetical protein
MKQLTKMQFPLHNENYEHDETTEKKYQDEFEYVVSVIHEVAWDGTFLYRCMETPLKKNSYGVLYEELDIDVLIESSDCKNGAEIGVSDEGYLTLKVYGQGYTLAEENHAIHHLVETTYEIICKDSYIPDYDLHYDEACKKAFEKSLENTELQKSFVDMIQLSLTETTLENVSKVSNKMFAVESKLEKWKRDIKRAAESQEKDEIHKEELKEHFLLTDELKEKFEKRPLYSTEEIPTHEKEVIAHFFNPTGVGDWYIVEGEMQTDGDVLMFGYFHLGDDQMAEWGYVSLNELENITLPFGLKIELDKHCTDKTINDVAKNKGLGLEYEPPSVLSEIKAKGTTTEKSVGAKPLDKEVER